MSGPELRDVVDPGAVGALIIDGYIRERTHPNDPGLRILNYTEKAQYERVWNHETQTCRGLILRGTQIIARPWAKFFNHGEHAEGTLDLAAPVEITDKLDGSLGILYPGPDGWAIATRGSFASEQAQHATRLLRDQYEPGRAWEPTQGRTYLFEIIYPGNRIVVDYGHLDDLLLLGAVDTTTGAALGPRDLPEWPGPTTATFPAATLAEALALEPRPNAEGIVVRFVDTGLMVKVKQEDYVRLHRLVTGLSERSVWEHLSANDGLIGGLVEQIPDEFHTWVRDVAGRLISQHERLHDAALLAHAQALEVVGDNAPRKDYALYVRGANPALAPYCFQILDGRDPAPAIWRAIKPVGFTPMLHTSEDVA